MKFRHYTVTNDRMLPIEFISKKIKNYDDGMLSNLSWCFMNENVSAALWETK